MRREKAKLSPEEHANEVRKYPENCEKHKIVEFVNSTKKKRKKEANHGYIDNDGSVEVSKEKKVRFSIEGEEVPSKGGEETNEKKKIRKPRWSEERKNEEKKRRAEEGPTKDEEAHRPKKKKIKKIKIQTVGDTTSSSSTSALQYLQHWQYDRSSWKFSKLKQTWLLKHIFDLKKIPASLFPLLVDYISSCQGGARLKTYKAAAKIIEKLEEKASVEDSEHEEEKEIIKGLEVMESEEDKEEIHQRARSIMQQLSDCT